MILLKILTLLNKTWSSVSNSTVVLPFTPYPLSLISYPLSLPLVPHPLVLFPPQNLGEGCHFIFVVLVVVPSKSKVNS